MEYRIIHKTEYIYHEPISICHNVARLLPRSTTVQDCKNVSVKIDPLPDVMNEFEDFFGNKVLYFAIQREHKKLSVTVTSDIEKQPAQTSLDLELYGNLPWEEVRQQLYLPTLENIDARQFVPETPITAFNHEIINYTLQCFSAEKPMLTAVKQLMHQIFTDFQFKPGFTTIATPVSEVMAQRKGVCQDFAHLAIACLRSIGLPARYVSGYIETIPPKGVEKLVGVDASHAWFSVYIPNVGWIDFDPTNNIMPSEQHITIGWGRDYYDITPLKGVILSSAPHKLSVSVDVRRK